MRKIALFFIGALLNAALATAQFSPATVYLKDGKTLTGFVKAIRNGLNPSELILYPQATEANAQSVPHESVKEFTVEGEGTFVAATVKKYTNALDFETISRIPDFENKEISIVQPLYLKVLVRGEKMNLYSYREGSRSNYFIQKPGGEIETLRYLRSLDPVNKNALKDYKYYLNQLLPFVSGNKKMENKLENAQWSDNSLTKLSNDINSNTTPYALYTGKDDEKSVMYAGVGVNMAHFKVKDANDYQSFYKNMSFKTSVGPVIQFGSELGFGTGNNLRFQVGISVFYLNTVGASTWDTSGTPHTAKINLKGLHFLFGPALKYNIAQKVQLGIGANITITSYTNVKSSALPNWVKQGIFEPFRPSKVDMPIKINPFVIGDILLTKEHVISIMYSPVQNNMEFYKGAVLRMGYGSIAYQYRFGGKNK
jgi:hypothetical protein